MLLYIREGYGRFVVKATKFFHHIITTLLSLIRYTMVHSSILGSLCQKLLALIQEKFVKIEEKKTCLIKQKYFFLKYCLGQFVKMFLAQIDQVYSSYSPSGKVYQVLYDLWSTGTSRTLYFSTNMYIMKKITTYQSIYFRLKKTTTFTSQMCHQKILTLNLKKILESCLRCIIMR